MLDALHVSKSGLDKKRLVETSGRAGLMSRAVMWLVTGALATRLAFDGGAKAGSEPDKQGALRTLARQPFGRGLLIVLLVGFIAMIVWSVVEMVREREGERDNHWGHRVVAGFRTLIYGGLAASTLPLIVGDQGSDSSGQERLTARALGWPGGRLLVGAIALALLAAAAFNIYRAASKRYEKHWDRSRMDARARRIAGPLEIAGNAGHALVFGVVGWFLGLAALRFDSTEPKSLDESLSALVRQSNGRALCLVVALGMVAWGLNAAAQSRWREIPAKSS